MKIQARGLNIDTSHFTGQRRWSDQRLRRAVEDASTWTEVIRLLGINDNAAARISVKGHAVRLGSDVTKFAAPLPVETPAAKREPSLDMLRFAGELLAETWFAMREIAVARPSQPAPYDLLVMLDGKAQRVQVKTTTCRQKQSSWIARIAQRPYVVDKSASRRPYDPDALDYFFVIDGDGLMYLIPSQVVAGLSSIAVGAYQDYLVGDCSSLLRSTKPSEEQSPAAL